MRRLAPACVQIGNDTISADTPNLAAAIATAVKNHGYPASADPHEINYPMTLLLLVILVIYVTMVYGPIAAWLVDPHPLQWCVIALSHRQPLVWRLPAGDRLCHRGCHGQHLFRLVVSGRGRGNELRCRADLTARNERPGYRPHVSRRWRTAGRSIAATTCRKPGDRSCL